MTSRRRRADDPRRSRLASISGILFLLLLGAAGASAGDLVGLYFDEAYTTNEHWIAPGGEMFPAYLVLHDASAAGGIGGWECQLRTFGEAVIVGVDYAGDALNVLSPPQFWVGMPGEPLPPAASVLLATLQFYTPDSSSGLILAPLDLPSVPDSMCYLDGADGTTLIPMSNVSDDRYQGYLRSSNPVYVASTHDLQIPSTYIGGQSTAWVRITNTGTGFIWLEPEITADADVFTLEVAPSEDLLPPGLSRDFHVVFTPTENTTYTGVLSFGIPGLEIALTATAREPNISWIIDHEAIDFGEVPATSLSSETIRVENNGEIDLVIEGVIEDPTGAFSFHAEDSELVIPSGGAQEYRVDFQPPVAGPYEGVLTLGLPGLSIPLSGTAREPVLEWDIWPDGGIDFGEIAIGQTATRDAVLINRGEGTLTFTWRIEGARVMFISEEDGETVTVLPGSSARCRVTFVPTGTGEYAATIVLDGLGETVEMTGSGRIPQTRFEVLPDSVAFGDVVIGYPEFLYVQVENTGDFPFEMDPRLLDESTDFQIEFGGPFVLQPNDYSIVGIHFDPRSAGKQTNELYLGEILPTVPISASAVEEVRALDFSDHVLNLGTTGVGTSTMHDVRIINRGNSRRILYPQSDSDSYRLDLWGRYLDPGEQAFLQVYFYPQHEGVNEAVISFGEDVDETIACTGVGTEKQYDLLGVWFDLNLTSYRLFPYESHGIVHIALINPSNVSGVTGWECALGTGAGVFEEWGLWGVAPVNELVAPDYRVGLGAPLLPTDDVILLARGLVLGSEGTAIAITLDPLPDALIPGEMSYLPADGSGPVVMRPFSGLREVAWIGEEPVALVAPPLRANLRSTEVHLSWDRPRGSFDLFRVLRRVADAEPEVLAELPAPNDQPTWTYVDAVGSLRGAGAAWYSYELLSGGTVVATSTEQRIDLSALPALQTRLLGNAPNPFNPQTEIFFELAEAGQVRIEIYDVAGRRVRTLADEQIPAGPQSRFWDGTDDQGRSVAAGAYYVRLATETSLDHHKVMLVK